MNIVDRTNINRRRTFSQKHAPKAKQGKKKKKKKPTNAGLPASHDTIPKGVEEEKLIHMAPGSLLLSRSAMDFLTKCGECGRRGSSS
jgi:hypothetical protein